MIPVPYDQILADSVMPGQGSIPLPRLNIPREFGNIAQNISNELANTVLQGSNNNPLLCFTFNLLNRQNWMSAEWAELLTFGSMYIGYDMSRGNNPISDIVNLFSSNMISKYPDIQSVLGNNVLSSANDNIRQYSEIKNRMAYMQQSNQYNQNNYGRSNNNYQQQGNGQNYGGNPGGYHNSYNNQGSQHQQHNNNADKYSSRVKEEVKPQGNSWMDSKPDTIKETPSTPKLGEEIAPLIVNGFVRDKIIDSANQYVWKIEENNMNIGDHKIGFDKSTVSGGVMENDRVSRQLEMAMKEINNSDKPVIEHISTCMSDLVYSIRKNYFAIYGMSSDSVAIQKGVVLRPHFTTDMFKTSSFVDMIKSSKNFSNLQVKMKEITGKVTTELDIEAVSSLDKILTDLVMSVLTNKLALTIKTTSFTEDYSDILDLIEKKRGDTVYEAFLDEMSKIWTSLASGHPVQYEETDKIEGGGIVYTASKHYIIAANISKEILSLEDLDSYEPRRLTRRVSEDLVNVCKYALDTVTLVEGYIPLSILLINGDGSLYELYNSAYLKGNYIIKIKQ